MDSARPAVWDGREADSSVQRALHRYLEHAPVPFAITRGDAHILVYANDSFCRLAGVVNGDALGLPIANAFSSSRAGVLSAVLDRAFRDRIAFRDEPVDPVGVKAKGWTCTAWPIIDSSGRSEALGIELRDAEMADATLELQRRVAEQMLFGALRERGIAEDAETARRRAVFLAEASRVLAQSVDQASTLVALTKLALPALGAWCIVDIIAEGGAIHRLPVVHPDPQKQTLALQFDAGWLPKTEDPFGAPAVLRDRQTIAITNDIQATLAAAGHSPENLDVLRRLGVESLLTVPLVVRGKLLGAVTFVGAERGRAHSAAEILLAEDLATRGALALDNAQAYDSALVLKEKAESANRAKTAFLGAMSHELRTPLNAIGGYVELLDMGLRGPVTEEQRTDFARVRSNQEYLLVLINEILNFVHVGSGRVSFDLMDVNVSGAVTRAVELIEPLIVQKGISWDGSKSDPRIFARADPEKVAQILVNVLSNAVKFTPKGGHISVDCEATAETALLRVSDSGIGIPSDKFESIFEPFVQLKDGLSDRGSGVGLGLAISRHLARAMNGDLAVESTEGKGTRFTLSLPLGSQHQGE